MVRKTNDKKTTDENGQYIGGRVKGKKNLTYNSDGTVTNENGVRFTEDEVKKLESLVNTANRKRKRMLKEEAELPRYIAGYDTGEKLGTPEERFGKESDFILAKKTKSVQRFRNHKEYEHYVERLKKVNSREYIDHRVQIYKDNYIKGLRRTNDGAMVDKIESIINSMSPKDFMNHAQSDEVLEIWYAYSEEEADAKLSMIHNALVRPQKKGKKKKR